jgi:glycerophosphoryl diester phosphodiesterase
VVDAGAWATVTAVYGHRGCTEGFLENTIEAFLEARRIGADGVEFDVRRSADGALVIHHDAAVPGVGLIHETRLADLPPHVPLFGAAIGACEGMAMNVEIKNKPGDPGYDPTGSLAQSVVAELIEHDRSVGVIISSFDAPTIEAARAAEPGFPIGWLLGGLADLEDARRVAIDRGYQAIHPFFVGVGAELVDRCHDGGIAVNVWTPNADGDLESMFDLGVDTLITDRLSAALSLAAGRARVINEKGNGGADAG